MAIHTHRRILSYAVIVFLSVTSLPSIAFGQQVRARTVATRSEPASEHPIDPALQAAHASLAHIRANVHDYTALFVKRNRIDGQLNEMTYARLKLRCRKMQNEQLVVPLSVYLDFLKPKSVKGREVIWVESQNDGKLIAHEAGFRNLVSVKLDPEGPLAMRNQRYPVSKIGLENLTLQLIETATRDRMHGECELKIYRDAKVGDHLCDVYEVIHPVHRPHFDFYRARVYFSQEHKVPIRYASWSWPKTEGGEPVLEEEYNYLNLQFNVGLTDLDFDKDNPNYRFW